MTNPQNFRSNVKDSYPTSDGDTAIVVGYKKYEEVTVKFLNPNTPENFTLVCQLGDLRRNRVKNPFSKSTFGIGYKGWGIYLTAKYGVNTSAWRRWSNMLSRCYNQSNKSYYNYGGRGVTVSSDWHNFQNYACWYYQNHIEDYDVDKDLLYPENLIYSKDTCCFLPREINSFVKSNLKVGVWFNAKINKYVAQIAHGGSTKHLGRFYSEEEARDKFIQFKHKKALELAKKYEGMIPKLAIENLLNYKDRFYE